MFTLSTHYKLISAKKMLFQTTFSVLFLSTIAMASNWDTYPSVSKTASINGFADPIYAKLPSCAQSCVQFDTGNTPCPYWDTGCFCVMPQWSGEVAECFAESCSGTDIDSATSLAKSLCSSVGAKTWMIPASASTALTVAEEKEGSVTSTEASSTLTTSSTIAVTNSAATSTALAGSSTSNSKISGSNSSSASTESTTAESTKSDSSGAIICTSSLLAIVMIYILPLL